MRSSFVIIRILQIVKQIQETVARDDQNLVHHIDPGNYGLFSLQFVSEQLIFFHKRCDIHMNNSAAMLNQIVPSDYIFRIIIFDAF